MKKIHLYTGLIVLIVIIAALLYYRPFFKNEKPIAENKKPEWMVDGNGYLSYPLNRSKVEFSRTNLENNGSVLVSKIIFKSRNANIYGLLVMPTTADELLPGIVLLPGAGVSKESELALAKNIAQLDAAVLVLDQRGVGETDGNFPTWDEDFASFLNNKEPYQHIMVYDALRAYDLLDSAPFVDSGRVIMAGESLGGRIAVIAAALDRNIDGVLAISSSGFDFKDKGDVQKDRFLKSIDSDHYIGQITPRKIVMIHNLNDTMIPLSSAINTFGKAQEPKIFGIVNDTSCNHGYCEPMWPLITEGLDYLVGIKSKTLVSVEDK